MLALARALALALALARKAGPHRLSGRSQFRQLAEDFIWGEFAAGTVLVVTRDRVQRRGNFSTYLPL